MMAAFLLFAGIMLFLIGTRLSAFFSGSETGFYRLSPLQLNLQAQNGDTACRRLKYFVSHPERFVATTLVGNNVANYVTTLAIGLCTATFVTNSSGTTEIVATILMTPVIFIFGELLPKSLYYRAPFALMRKGAGVFSSFYHFFLPLSYPLILVARLVSRFDSDSENATEVVLGRHRLSGLLAVGHREGILTRLQNQLAENTLLVSAQRVDLTMVPPSLCTGLDRQATREEIMIAAQSQAHAFILLGDDSSRCQWTHIVRVADLMVSGAAMGDVVHPLPTYAPDTPRLEVVTDMFRRYATHAAIVDNGRVVGIVIRQHLVSQLFRVSSMRAETGSPVDG